MEEGAPLEGGRGVGFALGDAEGKSREENSDVRKLWGEGRERGGIYSVVWRR